LFGCIDSTESFSHLCLLQGLLSHANNYTLAFRSAEDDEVIASHGPGMNMCLGESCPSAEQCSDNDERGSVSVLLQLLPAIKQLCMSAKFKYHAFRLLELWIGRLKSVCQDNCDDLSYANKCLASVNKDLLELLAGHMDCSVDGVTELVGGILNSVMQLQKMLSRHTSE